MQLDDFLDMVKDTEKSQLGLDFDGVIHKNSKGFHDGTCYGKPIKGSLEAIKKLSKNFKIIIFSSKVKKDRPLVNGKTGMQLVKNWLKKHKVLNYITEITCEKPRAKYYIDDKAIEFKSWAKTLKKIK